MRTQWPVGSETHKVTSPVSLIITAFATLPDVRGTFTPQLDAQTDDTSLLLGGFGRRPQPHGRQHIGTDPRPVW